MKQGSEEFFYENEFDKKDTTQKNWWINISNNRVGLKIYAKIPFFEFTSKKNDHKKNDHSFFGNSSFCFYQ